MDNIQSQEFFVVSCNSNPFQTYLPLELDKGFTHVAVSSCCIPKTYYVLPNRAVLTINQGGSYIFVTFPAGNYSVASFPALFSSLVNTAPGVAPFVYSCTFPNSGTSVQTSKFTFSVTNNAGVQPVFTINDFYLGRVMGFQDSQNHVFVGDSLISTNVVNFQSYDELLIQSDMVTNKSNLLQEIYSSANQYNSSIIWSNNSLPLNAKILNPTSSNVYTFSLVDEYQNLINLNGSEWSFIITVFKVSDFEKTIKQFIEMYMLQEHNKQLE